MNHEYHIAAPWGLSPAAELLPNVMVSFDAEGCVTRFQSGLTPQQIDSTPRATYHNGILIPGMVNAHCHLELSNFEGVIPQGTGLVKFVKSIVSQRNNFTEQQQREDATTQDMAMWSSGTQAVGDISNGTMSFEAKHRASAQGRTAYHTFAEYFGMQSGEAARVKYEQDTLHIPIARELGLPITPTPHSTYLVSEDLFGYATDSKRLSIHFLETPSEIDLFERRGGMYDFLLESDMAPDFLHHRSHVQRLIDTLDRDTPLLLVHCTQISRDEAQRLMDHFTDLTFVLCPRSNHYIERGFPPAEMLYELGARVALGTDSLASNTSLSMASEIGWLAEHNSSLPLAAILGWATRGGAQALGMSLIGRFAVGCKPGAVLIEGGDVRGLTLNRDITSRRLL